jgi:hypothetical protein
MYHVTERNERNSRTHAIVLAIGLHLSLGFLLYTQMSEPSMTKAETPAKVNVAKEQPQPMAKTVSQRP